MTSESPDKGFLKPVEEAGPSDSLKLKKEEVKRKYDDDDFEKQLQESGQIAETFPKLKDVKNSVEAKYRKLVQNSKWYAQEPQRPLKPGEFGGGHYMNRPGYGWLDKKYLQEGDIHMKAAPFSDGAWVMGFEVYENGKWKSIGRIHGKKEK